MERFHSIVVPTDFSPLAEAASRRAAGLARLDGAAIHLVHVVDAQPIVAPYAVALPEDVHAQILRAARERLERERAAVEKRAGTEVTAEVVGFANAVAAIVDAAASREADLVVMGTHGHGGLQRFVLGSTAERTLHSVPIPVLAVKDDPESAELPIRRIVVPIDFSPHSDRAVEIAAGLAQRLGASVELVHVVDLPARFNPYVTSVAADFLSGIETVARDGLERAQTRFRERQVACETLLRRGDPSTEIAERARRSGAQLVVMGTRGAGGLRHVLFGSVAERTLRAAPCSVLAVKAADAPPAD